MLICHIFSTFYIKKSNSYRAGFFVSCCIGKIKDFEYTIRKIKDIINKPW